MHETTKLIQENEPTMEIVRKVCPLCKGTMILKPFKEPFIETEDGIYVFFKPARMNKRKVAKIDFFKKKWCCKNCSYGEDYELDN